MTRNNTLLYLQVSKIYSYSPFIARQHETVNIRKGFSMNSISNFHFGSTKLYIEDSKFTKYLSSVVINNGLQIHKTGIIANEPPTTICNSIFRDINEQEVSGAAISGFGSLKLINCLFENIKAKEAPAYRSIGDFTVFRCSFKNLYSFYSNGIFISKHQDSIDSNFSFSNSFNTSAHYNGLFSHVSNAKLSFSHTNMTKGVARDCVAGFELDGKALIIEFTCFSEISSNLHHGVGLIGSIDDVFVSNSVFAKCSHKTDLHYSAACLKIERSRSIHLSNCYVMDNEQAKGKAMYFETSENPVFNNCYFSCRKEDIFSSVKPEFNDCLFDIKKTELPEVDYIGFNSRYTYKDKFHILTTDSHLYEYLWQSLAVSFIFSLVAACLHLLLSKRDQFPRIPRSLK